MGQGESPVIRETEPDLRPACRILQTKTCWRGTDL